MIAAIDAYPADEPPWAEGDGAPALERLLASRDRRLARLAEALGMAIDTANGEALVRALDDWTYRAWPRRPDLAEAPELWRAPAWPPGDAPLFTAIVDAGLALGDCAVLSRPGFRWAVADDPGLEADGDWRFGHVVAMGRYDPERPTPLVVYDALDEAFMRLQAIASPPADGQRESFSGRLRHVTRVGPA